MSTTARQYDLWSRVVRGQAKPPITHPEQAVNMAKPVAHSKKEPTEDDSKYSQAECRLFLLPPELRLDIYAYAMAPNIEQDTDGEADTSTAMVDISTAASSAPSHTLLLTCRRIPHESKELFIETRRAFWSDNLFSIELKDDYENYDHKAPTLYPNLPVEAKELMNQFVVFVKPSWIADVEYRFTDAGKWNRDSRVWTVNKDRQARAMFCLSSLSAMES